MLSITAQKGKNFLLTLILKRIISIICMANHSCAGCTEEAQGAPALQIISTQQESQALWKSRTLPNLDCNGHVSLLEKHLWQIATLRGQHHSLDLAEKLNLPCPRRGWCEDTSSEKQLQIPTLSYCSGFFFFFYQDYVICIYNHWYRKSF